MSDRPHSDRPDYGIDAPKSLRGLLVWGSICGLAALALAWLGGVPLIELPSLPVILGQAGQALGFIAIGLLVPVPVMLWSSLAGKLRIRDAVLDAAQLRGGESVLDVGCGRGLLVVGAARRLTSGRAFGVDLWSGDDLTGNGPEAALRNAALEGVQGRVTIETGDARSLPWRTASFDVVVSATALHNIPDAAGREMALGEIVRVLKPGGRLSMFDIFKPWSYRRTLEELGMDEVRVSAPQLYWLVPGARITARKPG